MREKKKKGGSNKPTRVFKLRHQWHLFGSEKAAEGKKEKNEEAGNTNWRLSFFFFCVCVYVSYYYEHNKKKKTHNYLKKAPHAPVATNYIHIKPLKKRK